MASALTVFFGVTWRVCFECDGHRLGGAGAAASPGLAAVTVTVPSLPPLPRTSMSPSDYPEAGVRVRAVTVRVRQRIIGPPRGGGGGRAVQCLGSAGPDGCGRGSAQGPSRRRASSSATLRVRSSAIWVAAWRSGRGADDARQWASRHRQILVDARQICAVSRQIRAVAPIWSSSQASSSARCSHFA